MPEGHVGKNRVSAVGYRFALIMDHRVSVRVRSAVLRIGAHEGGGVVVTQLSKDAYRILGSFSFNIGMEES